MQLKPTELATFDAIVDTLLPAVAGDGPAWTTPGSDLRLSSRLTVFFDQLPRDRTRRDLATFLRLLGSRAGGLLLFGRPARFEDLDPSGRARAIHAMQRHPLSRIRAGVRALKTLAGMLWMTTEDDASPDSWSVIGYPGPGGPAPSVPKPISVLDMSRVDGVSCDVVVVGSGAGGGTAAGVLAEAGLDVVVVEAGHYRNESDFTHLENEAYRDLYLDGSTSNTHDGGITVLAGSTLGGGTVVNYTTSLAPPQDVREEWDAVSGLDVFTSDEFGRSIEAVSMRLGVNRNHGWPSSRARILERGLRELGWHVDEMPRNVQGCAESECGFCTLGCRLGAKQSTLLTYLQDAASRGARFVTDAVVERVLTDSDSIVGVEARIGRRSITISARTVVLAAGALNTPAILLRSGVGGPAAGKHLRLHPVTPVWGRYSERVEPWTGILQARYSDQFADLDGDGYGFRFETAPVHPLLLAAFVGWEGGPAFKRDLLGLGNFGVVGVLLRDRDGGRVSVHRDGSPMWRYSLSRRDMAHMREGVRRAAEVHAAAGADEVIAATISPVRWHRGGSLDDFIAAVDRIGYGSNRMSYVTFHQMGSARMGADPAESVVDGENQVHGTRGLYVMDGSCFPTASGVNPMVSIASIAHRASKRLATRLTSSPT